MLQEELDNLANGLNDNELNKAKNGLELALIDSLKDIEGCAEALGHHETNFGDFSKAFTAHTHYATVTPATLKRVAQEVFRASNRNVVLALPDGSDAESHDE